MPPSEAAIGHSLRGCNCLQGSSHSGSARSSRRTTTSCQEPSRDDGATERSSGVAMAAAVVGRTSSTAEHDSAAETEAGERQRGAALAAADRTSNTGSHLRGSSGRVHLDAGQHVVPQSSTAVLEAGSTSEAGAGAEAAESPTTPPLAAAHEGISGFGDAEPAPGPAGRQGLEQPSPSSQRGDAPSPSSPSTQQQAADEERHPAAVPQSGSRPAAAASRLPQLDPGQGLKGLGRFKMRTGHDRQAKLESFDRKLGRQPNAILEVRFQAASLQAPSALTQRQSGSGPLAFSPMHNAVWCDSAAAGVQVQLHGPGSSTSSFLPQWLASPLGITRSPHPAAPGPPQAEWDSSIHSDPGSTMAAPASKRTGSFDDALRECPSRPLSCEAAVRSPPDLPPHRLGTLPDPKGDMEGSETVY